PLESVMCDTRLPRIAGEAFMEVSPSPRRVEEKELAELFRNPELAALGAMAVAPLPTGHGVRGWLFVARPKSGEGGLTDERLRLLEGLSYRSSMALQKARLARHREQSLHVADALVEYARALARDAGDAVEERIVRLAAELLGANEVSLWLQAEPGAEIAAVAVWDEDEHHQTLLLDARFEAATAQPFSELSEPFVLQPEQYAEISGVGELSRGGDVAMAPFTLDGSRMGFLVAGAQEGETFGELQLKMLAGLADQATLALG
ncbi:MAG: GAF domain-containing protein, partial [Gaiellaceae bacterium]